MQIAQNRRRLWLRWPQTWQVRHTRLHRDTLGPSLRLPLRILPLAIDGVREVAVTPDGMGGLAVSSSRSPRKEDEDAVIAPESPVRTSAARGESSNGTGVGGGARSPAADPTSISSSKIDVN